MELDHVLVPLSDLSSAVSEFERRFGLVSVEGGPHARWGTANRIVPLGDTYLELIAVVDQAEAAQSAFGRWVGAARPGEPLGWAVRTDDLEGTARRLGLPIGSGSRSTRTGVLRWRMAGLEQAMAEPSLPFFIEWAAETRFPGRVDAERPAAAKGIARLMIEGKPERVSAWLGAHRMPVVVGDGRTRVAAVVLATSHGELTVGSPPR